jgi:hypothetical protein
MANRSFYGSSNVPGARYIEFKFSVDGANPPAFLNQNPLNLYIQSVQRVSQGIYRLTLADSYNFHIGTSAELNVAGTGVQRWAQPGPIANFGAGQAALPTVDILVVDNANAVQDPPAAGAQNFISGTLVLCDSGQV